MTVPMTMPMPELSRLIYTSVLQVPTPVAEVSSIIRTSRAKNPDFGITGVLLFDGQHFCQYIEGEPRHVSALAANIRRDVRHTDFKTIYSDNLVGGRRFSSWRAGYPTELEPDALSKILCTSHDSMFASLMHLTSSFDLV